MEKMENQMKASLFKFFHNSKEKLMIAKGYSDARRTLIFLGIDSKVQEMDGIAVQQPLGSWRITATKNSRILNKNDVILSDSIELIIHSRL
jgi:hypothetical protein